MTLDDLQALLAFLRPGTRHTHDLSDRPVAPADWRETCARVLDLGLLRINDTVDGTVIETSDDGLRLLDALRDAERLAEVTRERDEARAAVGWLARQYSGIADAEDCDNCPARGVLCDSIISCWIAMVGTAYASTGGTVPAPADETD